MCNCDRFVLWFRPKFYLLLTPARLPVNQIKFRPSSASCWVMRVRFNFSYIFNTFHSGLVNWFCWFANVPYRYPFSAIVFRSFATSQDTFEKSPKRKNSHHRCLRHVWAQESVLRLSQIKCWLTLYSLRFMIHAKTKPNNGLSGVAFSWAVFFLFVASQPH